MSLIEVNSFFPSLNRPATFYAILPDGGAPGAVPVIYLLHGVQDDGTGWLRYTSAERYARFHNVALILPDAGNSFYADMAAGPQMFTFLADELPAECRRLFGLSPRREDNYVFGLSMGGYGAMKAAFTYPERYAGCAAFSAAVQPDYLLGLTGSPLTDRELTAIWGGGAKPPANCDLFALAEHAARGAQTFPRLLFSCGTEDGLYPFNVELHDFLTQKEIQHTFRSRPGAHSWALWDEELEYALDTFFPL